MDKPPPLPSTTASTTSSAPKKLPAVRKNKKSSYKPLSKLNEDRLTELTCVQRPEYTGRVFYFGLATRARLRHDVNVWFRDHQHSLALLQREQRAVQRRRGKMQKDVRRARREDYRRRQEDIREKLTNLQLRLLQRRVVQNFQRNAMDKMAARGEQSLVGLRMRGLDPSHVIGRDSGIGASASVHSAVGNSAGNSDAGNAEAEEDLPDRQDDAQVSAASLRRNQCHPDRRDSTSSDRNSEKNEGCCEINRNTESGIHKQAQGSKSLPRRFSEGDLRPPEPSVEPLPGSSTQTVEPSSLAVSKPATSGRRNSILHIIPEDSPPTNDPGDGSEDPAPAGLDQKNIPRDVAKQNPASLNGRVLEVRKNRPHSPKTRSIARPRRATLATLPQTVSKLKPLPPVAQSAPQTSHAAAPERDTSSHHQQRREAAPNLNSTTSASSSTPNSDQTRQNSDPDTDASPQQDPQESKPRKKSEIPETEKAAQVNQKASSPGQGEAPFNQAPDRAQVMEDLAMVLGEEGQEDGVLGKGSSCQGLGGARGGPAPSLAARLRQQRKREAKRRSELLDKEPLVQYYRSCRGTLEPLMTQPTRKSFPFPSSRAQYEQNKLLREELQKHVDRRQDIDNFFNTIFNDRQTESQKPSPPQGDNTTASKAAPKGARQMNLLLKMRQTVGASLQDQGTSIQHLAACQYLRVYDWEAKNKGEKDRKDTEPELTSWAAAENRLKAGFLALDFTGHS